MEELLSLKWNNHRSTFLHILTILRDKQLYTDSTLACDGKFYNVHRLVLSTCSDYFSAMFDRTTTCKNPIIVLKDIKCEDLEALLDYMYLGEVNVRQADLASLIKAAECLRVKGLAVPDDEPVSKKAKSDTSNVRRSDGAGSPPSKRKRREESQDKTSEKPKSPQTQIRLSPYVDQYNSTTESSQQNDTLGKIDQAIVKIEADDPLDEGGGQHFGMSSATFKEEDLDNDHADNITGEMPEFLDSNDDSYSQSFPGTSYQSDLQNWSGDPNNLTSTDFSNMGFPAQSQDGAQNASGGTRSNVVGGWKDFRSMTEEGTNLENHNCSICFKYFAGRNWKQDLSRHMRIHTGEKPFACPYCPHRSTLKSNLRNHVLSRHIEKQLSDLE